MERRPQLGAEAFRNQVASIPNRPLPPSRRVEVTSQCATLAFRRFDSGRLLRTYDLEREDARGSYDARARVTRREHRIFAARVDAAPIVCDGSQLSPALGSRHPMRARARCALKARRVSSDAYTSPIATALPGPSCPRAIGGPFPSCRVTCSPAHVRITHGVSTVVARCHVCPPTSRARRARRGPCEGAVRNLPAFGPAPFPQ